MSQWHEVEKENISFSDDLEEMHLWLYSDDDGNVYASVKVAEVLRALQDKNLL